MPSKRAKKPRSLSGKLMAVEPEYRFAVYKRLTSSQRGKKSGRGSPVLSGSFENGKRR
jgi:hypothetical protein